MARSSLFRRQPFCRTNTVCRSGTCNHRPIQIKMKKWSLSGEARSSSWFMNFRWGVWGRGLDRPDLRKSWFPKIQILEHQDSRKSRFSEIQISEIQISENPDSRKPRFPKIQILENQDSQKIIFQEIQARHILWYGKSNKSQNAKLQMDAVVDTSL